MCAFQRACERRGGRERHDERHDVGISCSCKALGRLCSSFYLGGNRPPVYENGEIPTRFRTLPVVTQRPCASCPFSFSQRRPGRTSPHATQNRLCGFHL